MADERPRATAGRERAAPPPAKSRVPLLLLGAVILAGAGYSAVTFFGKSTAEDQAAIESQYASAAPVEAETLVKAWRADNAGYDKQNRGRITAVAGVVAHKETIEGAYGAGTLLKLYLKGLDSNEIL